MMRVDSRDRLSVRDDLLDTRSPGRTIALLAPTVEECESAGCGYDAASDSGIDATCSSCDGLGQVVTNWAVSEIKANIRIVDQALVTFGQTPAGSQLGDTFVTIGLRDLPMMRMVYNNPNAYIALDNHSFRPNSIEAAGLGRIEEYVVLLVSNRPRFRKKGY